MDRADAGMLMMHAIKRSLGILWSHRDYPRDHRVILVAQSGWPLGVRQETGHDTTMEALRRLRGMRPVAGAYIVRARPK